MDVRAPSVATAFPRSGAAPASGAVARRFRSSKFSFRGDKSGNGAMRPEDRRKVPAIPMYETLAPLGGAPEYVTRSPGRPLRVGRSGARALSKLIRTGSAIGARSVGFGEIHVDADN
jgi:hypothetical protein